MNDTLVNKALNPTQDVFSVLGSLCNNPMLLNSVDVNLSSEDFVMNFHKVIFYAINNLVSSNGKINKITEFDIDTYLKKSDKYYHIWDGDNNGIEYISNARELSNKDLFAQSYETIKKYSILREYIKSGFDISDILDIESIEPEVLSSQQKELLSMSPSDIIEFFTKKALTAREKLKKNVENGIKYFKVGDDIEELKDRMNAEPAFGYPHRNPIDNTLFNGSLKGKVKLTSSGTGGGKTRRALMNMLYIACDTMRSDDGDWEKLATPRPSLFISTELEKEELQEQMLSFITKVPPEIIKAGHYTSKIEESLDKGIKILKRAPLWIIEMEEFDTDDIRNEIERYILNHDVEYIAFDYIQMTPKLSSNTQNNFGHNMTDDQMLLEVSRVLKNIAKEYNVFIETATQLNGSQSDNNPEISRTQNALRGAKAIADKVDYGIIATKPSAYDLKHIKKIDSDITPNMSYWVYKNRNGKKGVVVWTYLDLGTMSEKYLFTTDYYYDIENADIDKTYIEIDDNGSFNVSDAIEV